MQENTALVLFRVGPVLCCAPAQPIQSIVAPPKLTRTPGSTETRPGIFHHNDAVVQVSDLRIRFGVSEAMRSQPGRMIITQQENGYMAFWVDEITEVIQSPKEGWGKLPAYIPKGIFSHTLLLNNEIHLYLEIEKLDELPDENYLSKYLQRFQPEEPEEPPQVEEHAAEAEAGGESADASTAADEASSSNNVVDTEKTPETEGPGQTTEEDQVSNTISTTEPDSTASATETSAIETSSETDNSSAASNDEDNSKTTEVRDQITESAEAGPAEKEAEDNNTDDTTTLNVAADTEDKSPSPSAETTPVTDVPLPDSDSAKTTLTNDYSEPVETRTVPITTPDEARDSDNLPLATETTEPDIEAPEQETTQVKPGSYELHPNHELIPPEKKAELEAEEQRRSKLNLLLISSAAVILLGAAITSVILLWPESNPIPGQQTGSQIKTDPTDTTTAKPVQDNYRAEIKHDQEGVVIEIEAPDDVVVLHDPNNNTETETTDIAQADHPATNSDTDKDEPVSESNKAETNHTRDPDGKPDNSQSKDKPDTDKPTQKTTKENATSHKTVVREVVHIVVKGDTLWDIAQHYVKDPYRYPELARLSNIKNPDRIYPGNRVRIIHRSKGNK